jgi:hypothetical protein
MRPTELALYNSAAKNYLMSFSHLFCSAYLCLSLIFFAQAPESKELAEIKGSLDNENVYRSPALQMKIPLPRGLALLRSDNVLYASIQAEGEGNAGAAVKNMPRTPLRAWRNRRCAANQHAIPLRDIFDCLSVVF